jgi:hypothetical protein
MYFTQANRVPCRRKFPTRFAMAAISRHGVSFACRRSKLAIREGLCTSIASRDRIADPRKTVTLAGAHLAKGCILSPIVVGLS